MPNLLVDALKCRNHGRPPVWFMRQAGRYLPEYRQLRSKHSFLDLCHTPELIVEVTKMPIDIIGFDAAILFSDILLIPEALGLNLKFTEEGPLFENPIAEAADIEALKSVEMKEAMPFVKKGIETLVKELSVPLIGFSGAPFTLASYMIEGKSSKDFKKTKKWMLNDPKSFHQLLDKLSNAVISSLNMQIDAGVSAVQIFDSWAWILSDSHFLDCSIKYLKKILAGIKNRNIPVIFFCRGSSAFAPIIAAAEPNAISVDWNANLKILRSQIPSHIAIQGNLDPDLLYAPKDELKRLVQSKLNEMAHDKGYVFNLGHGIHPDTPVDSVKFIVDFIKSS